MIRWRKRQADTPAAVFVPVPVPVHVQDEPTGEPPDEQAGLFFEMSVSTNELAGLFHSKGWQVADAAGPNRVPDAYEILTILHRLATDLIDSAGSHNSAARLMALKDPDYPGAVDLYLYIGNVDTNDYSDDESEEDPLIGSH